MGELGVDDLEKLKGTGLDEPAKQELLTAQTECTFIFNHKGWPSGVVMSFIWQDGRVWLTAVEGRRHVKALADDNRVSVVVSSKGALPGRQMISFRGEATVHRDRETIDWFLGEFTQRLQPEDPLSWRKLLDSPNRVVFEVRPVEVAASHDQRKLPGNGRGMAAEPERSQG